MKNLSIILLLSLTFSCSYFNHKTVNVAINSNPTGASIIIDGVNYGTTPANITIQPKNYQVTLFKNNYSGKINLETWTAIRKNRGDGIRCFADAMGTMFILPGLAFFSGNCADFKKEEYFVNLSPLVGNSKNYYNNQQTAPNQPNLQNNFQKNSSNQENYYSNEQLQPHQESQFYNQPLTVQPQDLELSNGW